MNTYEKEQELTDKHGNAIMAHITSSFNNIDDWERVTDKETQIAGADFLMWNTGNGRKVIRKVDIKFDFYKNENFVFELSQQYDGVGEESWIAHDKNIWIAYFKLSERKIYMVQISDLVEFMKTPLFKKRKVQKTNYTINGKPGTFKNFKLSELPIHHVIDMTSYCVFHLNEPLKESWPDEKLYENVFIE